MVQRKNQQLRSRGPASLSRLIALLALALVMAADTARALPERPEPPAPIAATGIAPETPAAPLPEVKARAAIVVDAVTGEVLYEKNARRRLPMASTTKIMTAILMLESGRLEETVIFGERAGMTEYANLHVQPGETFRMRDLLYPVLLKSSNDTCVAVAEHLAGTPWAFAARMTERARELGALDTRFVTTSGLYHPDHYSTAYDLALITRHAFRYPLFNEVVATRDYALERPLNPDHEFMRNHNKLLRRYEGADGVKTGYVRQSGHCLVASATRPDGERPWRLITVVLNSPQMYDDSTRLQDWTRANFRPVFRTWGPLLPFSPDPEIVDVAPAWQVGGG